MRKETVRQVNTIYPQNSVWLFSITLQFINVLYIFVALTTCNISIIIVDTAENIIEYVLFSTSGDWKLQQRHLHTEVLIKVQQNLGAVYYNLFNSKLKMINSILNLMNIWAMLQYITGRQGNSR